MINNELNKVFKDMTKSILSKSEREYNNTLKRSIDESASLNLGMESNNTSLDTIDIDVEEYSNDEFSNNLKESFRKLVGKEGRYKDKETIGTHPDFKDIEKTKMPENHYIVSMFVDIKNSTSIYLKNNNLLKTKYIKNEILRVITVFMQVFDGHVHRLQGDAVFSYFGWKDKCEEDAIIDSLNAASFLLYYVENILHEQFEENELSPIKIRIGIDFGEKDEVLWSEYGLAPSTEVTTTSLHTDLAAKLQNQASSNSIMIGDNIKTFLDLPKEFISKKTYQENGEKKEKDYILKKPEKYYKMWVFQHKNYLKYFPFLEKSDFNMQCLRGKEEYFPNIVALEKGETLTFIIKKENEEHPLHISNTNSFNPKKFKWSKENRGKEARNNNQEQVFALPNSEDKIKHNDATAYRGHHTITCKVKEYEKEHIIKFGVFIK